MAESCKWLHQNYSVERKNLYKGGIPCGKWQALMASMLVPALSAGQDRFRVWPNTSN
jgi:hypothetical protein